MTRLRLSLALAAALLLAGCASTTISTTGAAQPSSPSSFVAAAYQHAQCMRAHGVADYPDPTVSQSDDGTAIKMVVSRNMIDSPHFAAADQACKNLLPDIATQTPAQRQAAQRAHAQILLAFARCLRSHGITGFPDPSADGQLTPQMVAGIDLQSSAFLSAARACVGATHGAITMADVERAIHRLGTAPASAGS